jgi:hypothetical protein
MGCLELPAAYPRIQKVRSFEELVSTRFEGGINALCWQRSLAGDFGEVAEKLALGEGITPVTDSQLSALDLSPSGCTAVETLLADLRMLRARDLDPAIDYVRSFWRKTREDPVATDVFSFHVDSATAEADTYLCTYHGLSSEGLRNDEALRRVEVPETRARLLARFGRAEGPAFEKYLRQHHFDLHYEAIRGARPFSFGVGNLWRIAVKYPRSLVPACIHRAPETLPEDSPRLLLIC